MTTDARVFIIHENPEWLPPLVAAFDAEGVPYAELRLTEGAVDLDSPPAPGVYWSRMSASAHTRGNEHSKDYTRAVLSWLDGWGATVVNGRAVIEVEVSKVQQHAALRAAGFDVPRTSAAFGLADLATKVREFSAPFITKHNQGGKGLGVRRFDSHEEFDRELQSGGIEQSPDGITLVQEFLVSAAPFVTRAEFVGGRFVYAVRVDTSAGSFELCPADACAVDDGSAEPTPLFSLREGLAGDPLIADYERFLAAQGIQIAGIEFIETVDGRRVTYDINTNTNYNPDVEKASPVSGPREIARFLGGMLAAAYPDGETVSAPSEAVPAR
jgi:hypothetical protein